MSMTKVKQAIADVERKLGKIDAMTSKGAKNMSVKDVLKMNAKGQSIQKTIKNGVKEFAVSISILSERSNILDTILIQYLDRT